MKQWIIGFFLASMAALFLLVLAGVCMFIGGWLA